MKKFYLLFSALLLTVFSFAQIQLPLDFESATVNYTFTDFGGGATTKIANPQISGINTSANVGKMIKGAGQVYGGSVITLAAPIDFSVNKTFKVKVFSPRVGAKLLLKVENATDGTINFQQEATSTIANGWEDLTFDYSTISTTNQYSKLVFIFDLGTMGDGTANYTWLFDEVRLTSSGGGGGLTQMNLPVTFDDATVNYGLVGFNGAEQSTIVVDPTLATNMVAKVIRTNTAATYAGTTVTALSGTVQTGFSSSIPFTATEKRMNVRVYSPHAGIQVRLKVEDKNDPTKSCETEATVTTANGWQTLEFNFANQAAGTAALNVAYSLNKATIFFNFGVTGAVAGERTYYFDDVKFGAAVGNFKQMDLPVTFDDTTVNYGLVGFAGAEQSTIVTDPTLATNKVAKVIKKNTAELYAGTTVTAVSGTVQTGFSSNIPFTAIEKRMNVRVYSPHAGIQVRLKVEDKNDPTKSCETEATVTTANGWQTLDFNFANQAAGTAALNVAYSLNKATIFFNFGVTGAVAGERTYYFDDVKFGSGNVPSAPVVVSPVSYCQNNTAVPLSATATAGNTLSWYTLFVGGVASSVAPIPSTANVGTINYYVSQTNSSSVESPRATISVTINSLPLVPVASPITYCQNTAAIPLTATASSGNSLMWYTVQTAGTGSTTAPTPSTTVAGITIYYASQVNTNGCEGARRALTVTVNPVPLAPIVTTPLLICLNAPSRSLTATAQTDNLLKWYDAAVGGIGLINAPTTVTTSLGSTTYYVNQTNSLGCESIRASLTTTIVAPPATPVIAATQGTQLIPGQTTTIAAANPPGSGNTYSWFRNGIELTAQTGNSIQVNIVGVGNYTLKITSAIGCQSTSNTVTINESSSSKLFVYPNPSSGKFQVRYFTDPNNLQPLQIAIYNSLGALIFSGKYTSFSSYSPMNIDLTKHGNGVYHLKMMNTDGKIIATETIIVHK